MIYINQPSEEPTCTICKASFSEDEGVGYAYFGAIPVSFCPTCVSGMFQMLAHIIKRGKEEGWDED